MCRAENSITLFSFLQPPLTLWRRGQSRQSYHLSSTFNRLLLATLLRIDLFWPFSQKQQSIATMDFWFGLNLWPLQHNIFAYFVRLSLKKSATGCQKNLWMQNFQGQKRPLWYKGQPKKIAKTQILKLSTVAYIFRQWKWKWQDF